jgi:protein-tyrosine phosphatase
MQPIYWVSTISVGRLGTMARPRGGEWLAGDLAALRGAGVDTLATLLTDAERDELELAQLPSSCQSCGLEWVALPIPDFDVPPLNRATAAFVAGIAERLRGGRQVVVHCRQGIGRSSLIAASALAMLGIAPSQAFMQIRAARGRPVPDTEAQRAWVERFAAAWPWLLELDAENTL